MSHAKPKVVPLKLLPYNEERKAAPIGFKPVKYHADRMERVIGVAASGLGHLGLVEAFDLMTQERIAVLVVVSIDNEGNTKAEEVAILHNGDLSKRLIQCCTVEEDGNHTHIAPEDWDRLPAFVPKDGGDN